MIIKKGNENILCEDGIVSGDIGLKGTLSGDSNTVMIANNTQMIKEMLIRITSIEESIEAILLKLNE